MSSEFRRKKFTRIDLQDFLYSGFSATLLDIGHSQMTDTPKVIKQYAPLKLRKLPLNKGQLFLQNQAAHGDAGAKDLLDSLPTPSKRNDLG
jgi:hypothetical protein